MFDIDRERQHTTYSNLLAGFNIHAKISDDKVLICRIRCRHVFELNGTMRWPVIRNIGCFLRSILFRGLAGEIH